LTLLLCWWCGIDDHWLSSIDDDVVVCYWYWWR
jgi:hypothetical protein